MKILAFLLCILPVLSCGNKNTEEAPETVYVEDKYDTVATDSFSPGAISADVARQIRESSVAYQDSVKAAQLAEAKKLADEKAKQDADKLKASIEKSLDKSSEKKTEKEKSPEKRSPETATKPENSKY